MKMLVVEDDFITRKMIRNILEDYGDVDIAVNGLEGLEAFQMAFEENDKYDVMFLDVKMPEMDGQEVLKRVREFEKERDILGKEGVKIIMNTALSDSKNIITAFREQCEAYIIKPVERDKIHSALIKLELI